MSARLPPAGEPSLPLLVQQARFPPPLAVAVRHHFMWWYLNSSARRSIRTKRPHVHAATCGATAETCRCCRRCRLPRVVPPPSPPFAGPAASHPTAAWSYLQTRHTLQHSLQRAGSGRRTNADAARALGSERGRRHGRRAGTGPAARPTATICSKRLVSNCLVRLFKLSGPPQQRGHRNMVLRRARQLLRLPTLSGEHTYWRDAAHRRGRAAQTTDASI